MVTQLKKLIVFGILGYALYFALSHHFVYFSGRDYAILPKAKMTLTNTFFTAGDEKRVKQQGLVNMLRENPDLRRAGLGRLLVEKGLVTEDELQQAEDKIDYGT